MTEEDILAQINKILIAVLGDPGVSLTMSTTVNDVPGWDSLRFMTVVVALEKHFNVRFTAQQVMGWKNLGSVCADLASLVRSPHGL